MKKKIVPIERKWKEEKMMGSSEEDLVKNQTEPNQEAQVNGRQANKEQGREILTYNKQIETQVKRLQKAPEKSPDFLWSELEKT
jgi:hypothetical protein